MSMQKLVVASNNNHKLIEIQQILSSFQITSLSQINFNANIPETSNTFKGNALIKAETIFKFCNLPTLSDDSGLVVESLNNQPGVFSARYAGVNATDKQNYIKLLSNMENISNRSAYFNCTLCLYINPKSIHYFNGKIHGNVNLKPEGENGFGYDPIFIPNKQTKSLAQLGPNFKNRFSHRAIALLKLKEFLLNATSF